MYVTISTIYEYVTISTSPLTASSQSNWNQRLPGDVFTDHINTEHTDSSCYAEKMKKKATTKTDFLAKWPIWCNHPMKTYFSLCIIKQLWVSGYFQQSFSYNLQMFMTLQRPKRSPFGKLFISKDVEKPGKCAM